jgi:hypothetical protein
MREAGQDRRGRELREWGWRGMTGEKTPPATGGTRAATRGREAEIAAAFAANYPAVQYAYVQFLSEHLADCVRTFDGDLEQVLVLAILGQALLQALARPEPAPETGALSASRIADVSGLPRETVRRKLAKLARRGWIRQVAGGAWVIVMVEGESLARSDLAGLDARGLARLARLHAGIERILRR